MATIRIDDELKHDADKMFDEVGMNTSVAVKIFLNSFVKTGKFPFDIETISYQPNTETLQAFKETENLIERMDLENGEDLDSYFGRMTKESVKEEHAKL
ncbi:type II toxin-antitoxin system RelB/DinJ family antitoxin [Enterococcus faecalis]|jgi:DNA-damage-inducible protein J|uniref:type II toxin-antitoxin system RelB/DinJ family antitoxin n=1 Tax=Enterococcus TaxID=1350 RepID=UPI00045B22A1|nr:type II toxin-antitoxin system RelB/DinJ family antitoxin [Enterococcus faecalis]EGO2842925.1 type II toxin-antitoxin system RelB/DinJ family antitoxin [Enterococcus faecalis]EGO7756743.1 type II toxin-antitoxin system RelB/DinJ family antitoxin [Enterococcus faecalis]EGO8011486.1 type II toxin-antitoxin system RelB/DinJ family antitoxin [Enterococcus faecalis]EGO8122274.1 type II toxin-antitoxin system RelB/DinJ family antitoxin [Enterococcus faecalis]EGO8408283.1 type II toxin-antitoxin s